jgi:hypothetical protein
MNQDRLMLYCPASGEERPYPSHAEQWRQYHGKAAWLFNPWTGNRRHAISVGTDPFGLLILPLKAEIHEAKRLREEG